MHELPFHPLIRRWFASKFGEPTAPQTEGWRHISSGRDTLIAAPTGSGKTLAAFLWAINELISMATASNLSDETQVVYVSPLKALGNDIQKNLREPLEEIRQLAANGGIELPEIRVLVRSGDTPQSERQSMVRRPPHILITTPESFYILLTAERSRKMLSTARTVIVDEIHAVAADKRGAHLALSLERLDLLAGERLQRIGLSATQKPIEEVARLLVGTERILLNGPPDCAIVDVGHKRTLDLRVEVTDQEMGPIASHELYAEIYERIVEYTKTHRTTIVFVNTRRLVERVAHQLAQRLGDEKVAAHHGSMSRKLRLRAEEGLKSGEIPVVVATASLELGIDVGHVDLVCHLGSARSIATLLQRVGRSGHWLGAVPKGILFPLTRDDLVQCAALVRAVHQGDLDRLFIPANALDILAQQIVATAASQEMSEAEIWDLVHRAYPYRHLDRKDFEAVLEMLSEGVATSRGRRSAHLHRDRVNKRLRGRRGARLAAITSGGAIPDTADYDVIEEPTDTFVGRVNEDFAIESMSGDIFLLGNKSWRIKRVESGKLRVIDAQGAPPTIPFWLGEAPARTAELSEAVAQLREEVAHRLEEPIPLGPPSLAGKGKEGDSASLTGHAGAVGWLRRECGVDESGAQQIVAYIAETVAMLGTVPTRTNVVAERFFDESGGMQLVIHAPFGGRINRAWGLALRKRFCRTFDFELQAAATDDGIVLSLGEQHSFPLENVFEMINPRTLREDLMQAALVAPMFTNRWRWNATRSLALLRHNGGKRVPMPIQRMRAEDLLAAVFPGQVACQDNHPGGPIEIPDHPLVNETVENCLHEAMDLDGFCEIVEAIRSGDIRTVSVDTPAPSPMSHEILNANPYAFLDDAPLEERRARAVSLRRTDPDLAGGIGALDAEAIAEVKRQAWPDVRDADELHDALLNLVVLPVAEGPLPGPSPLPQAATGKGILEKGGAPSPAMPAKEGCEGSSGWSSHAATLVAGHRATWATWNGRRALVAAERVADARAALDEVDFNPRLPTFDPDANPDAEEATRAMVRGWMEVLGPTTTASLASLLGISDSAAEGALCRLESEGIVLRGSFTGSAPTPNPEPRTPEWCERRLLARIHRLTIGRLRKEIEAVSPADFMRFLLRWQHVNPGSQLHGRDGIAQVIGQLQGLELPAPAWERDVLPARINLYNGNDLEQLCLGGEIAWGRLRMALPSEEGEPIQLPGASLLAAACRPSGAEVSGAATRSSALQGRHSRARGFTPGSSGRRRRAAPSRAAPLAFVLRDSLPDLLERVDSEDQVLRELSPRARDVFRYLKTHGAAFLNDVARALGLLPTQTEEALWELVARGVVTGDGIAGLRTLLLPQAKRRSSPRRLRGIRGGAARRSMPVGRWSLLRTAATASSPEEEAAERFARLLLRRYGVVLRELLAREVRAPAWRTLLQIYRRLEARGEIRGGRFVNGFVGEQYALPEAVDTLRAVRRAAKEDEAAVVSAADPLNLVGIITPGARLSPFSNQVIAYHNGVPAEIGELGEVMHRLQRPTAQTARERSRRS
jgi:ATP-dependent Lhr-like helicase